MDRNIIRTAQGKTIDLDELRMRNRHVSPIGNKDKKPVEDNKVESRKPKIKKQAKIRKNYAKNIPVSTAANPKIVKSKSIEKPKEVKEKITKKTKSKKTEIK